VERYSQFPQNSIFKEKEIMQRGRINLTMGLQFGSEGKGLLSGHLALLAAVDVAVCDFGPNTGHTFVDVRDEKTIVTQLPMAVVNPMTQLVISSGAIIHPPTLLKEIEENNCGHRVTIDPNAAIVTEECRQWEQKHLPRISSTKKGAGAALAWKVMRHPDAKIAGMIDELKPFLGEVTPLLWKACLSNKMILGEQGQGFWLSRDHSNMWPYCTGRNVTSMAFMDGCGLPSTLLGNVYGALRTFPIRVGNDKDSDGTDIGYSGNAFEGSKELSWEDITVQSRSSKPIQETTTVTGKIRRVFTFSMDQVIRAININGVTDIFVNFLNYLDDKDSNARDIKTLSSPSLQFLGTLQMTLNQQCVRIDGRPLPVITFGGVGPTHKHVIDISPQHLALHLQTR